MSNLDEKVLDVEFFKDKFKDWKAKETIIDDKRAIWELKKPNSEYEKICLYRDGKDMFVYGDYGQFTFDSMTWKGSIYNLEYDDIGYQFEKLSQESKKALMEYDSLECEKDILDWLEYVIEENFPNIRESDGEYKELMNKIKEALTDCIPFFADSFCRDNSCEEIENLLYFTDELLSNTEDENEWISFLRNNYSELNNFESGDVYESSLWHAGNNISQSYFICLYALRTCRDKLIKEE